MSVLGIYIYKQLKNGLSDQKNAGSSKNCLVNLLEKYKYNQLTRNMNIYYMNTSFQAVKKLVKKLSVREILERAIFKCPVSLIIICTNN
jgi:hypothetical protein